MTSVSAHEVAPNPVLELLAERTGLAFPPWRRPAVEAIVARAVSVTGARDAAELARRLRRDEALLDRIAGDVTVGETWFWREPERLDLLADVVLPEVLARRGDGHTLRLWSAGCATGEEPYTLAILARERGLADRCRILGTDLSRAALERARAALYRPWALRGLDPVRQAAHFRPAGARFALDPVLRSAVVFAHHNLASGLPPSELPEADLVLCRNVLIYMDAPQVRRVAELLWSSLAPGGWLMLGASDPQLGAPFEVVSTSAGLIYRRPVEPTGEAPRVAAPEWGASPPLAWASPPPVSVSEATFPDVSKAATSPDRPAPVGHEPGRDADSAERGTELPLSASEHLTLGLLQLDSGEPEHAERSLRRALYLDRELAPAHFALGALLLARGDAAGAERSFRNAATIAAAMPADAPVPHGGGEPWGGLADAARHHLAIATSRARGPAR
ncbi:MAG: hypothetical protein AMXMBFR64_56710 [Myxococcales bacterium]